MRINSSLLFMGIFVGWLGIFWGRVHNRWRKKQIQTASDNEESH